MAERVTDPLARLERLLARATPRPWGTGIVNGKGLIVQLPEHLAQPPIAKYEPEAVGDAALIVALVNAAPHLIAVARAAERAPCERELAGVPRCGSHDEADARLGQCGRCDALAALRAALGETQ